MPKTDADKMVRYCPECGLIGPVKPPAVTCCPDSFGVSIRRWQAERFERMLERLRAARAHGAPPLPPDEAAMIDAAMVEMANIHPPLRRSDCARLIRAAVSVGWPDGAPVAPRLPGCTRCGRGPCVGMAAGCPNGPPGAHGFTPPPPPPPRPDGGVEGKP